MGIFATNKAVASLAFRLGEISVEVDSLKRANRSLELEFTELYDKVRHQMSRMAKRTAVEAKELNDAEPILPAPGEVDAISAKILARRDRGRMS